MFPFLMIFIVFCILLSYYIKKSDNDQKKITEEFWEKELRANAVRKKDISKLDYITIPLEKIPEPLGTSCEKSFFSLAEKPMLNLTGISNTDLKLSYGTANLNILSEYDNNYAEMISLLPEYCLELQKAGQEDTAQMLLEFAVNKKADSRKIYSQLAAIYQKKGLNAKIDWLMTTSEVLPEITKNAIQKDLSAMY